MRSRILRDEFLFSVESACEEEKKKRCYLNVFPSELYIPRRLSYILSRGRSMNPLQRSDVETWKDATG